MTWRILSYRRDHAGLFAEGDYQALEVLGLRKQHVIAFRRQHGEEAIVAVAPRLVRGLTGGREVWEAIGRFFEDLDARARPDRRAPAHPTPDRPAASAAERS